MPHEELSILHPSSSITIKRWVSAVHLDSSDMTL